MCQEVFAHLAAVPAGNATVRDDSHQIRTRWTDQFGTLLVSVSELHPQPGASVGPRLLLRPCLLLVVTIVALVVTSWLRGRLEPTQVAVMGDRV